MRTLTLTLAVLLTACSQPPNPNPIDPHCTPQSCGTRCGSVDDGCGTTIDCGACPTPCTPGACPASSCGVQPDGCGGQLDCGPCACVPKTCANLGAECGSIDDGCGARLDCGGCASGQSCGSNRCTTPCAACPAGFQCDSHGACIGDLTRLDLDVQAQPVAGALLLNGTRPTCSAGTVSVAYGPHRFTGSCDGGTWAYSGAVPRGTYDVTVEGDSASVPFPDYPVVARKALSIVAPTTVDLDVKRVTISGKVTLNGATPARGCGPTTGGAGVIVFRDVSTPGAPDHRAELSCWGFDMTFSASLAAGTYRVEIFGDASALPRRYLVGGAMAIASGSNSWNVDITTHPIGVTLTHNGAVPAGTCVPVIDNERALVRLTDPARTTVELAVPCSGAAVFTGQVPDGTYEVSVRGTHSDLPALWVPSTPSTFVVPQTGPVTLDVRTVSVSGTVLVNGAMPSATCGIGRARVTLDGPARAELTLPCGTGPFAWSAVLPRGRYAVSVLRASGSSGNLPSSPWKVMDLELTQSTSNVSLDVVGAVIDGSLTLNGGSFPCGGVVWLREAGGTSARHADVQCSATGGATFSTIVPAGATFTPEVFLKLGSEWATFRAAPFSFAAGSHPLAVDVVTRPISVTVTQNGVDPVVTCSEGRRARINLLTPDSTVGGFDAPCDGGTAVAIHGDTFIGSYGLQVYSPGSWLYGTQQIPAAQLTVGPTGGQLIADLKTRIVSGKVTVNAVPLAAACSSDTRVLFTGKLGTYRLPLVCAPEPTYRGALTTGDVYDVELTGLAQPAAPTGKLSMGRVSVP